ncbi:MAG: RNA 3'-terminal phosphate cyclase [Pseudomonadota bacterium]
MIEIDGAAGEGGGQILRTALTLAMITGQAIRMVAIRARRPKPGLLRQHLTAVEAATAICRARVEGAAVGSQTLEFHPGPIRGGDYRFAIGTAGSCTLVLQTVLPALWFADGPSTFAVSGGTHNPAAPPADFLRRSWLPVVAAMGVDMELELLRHGFYPAGGGEMLARVRPASPLTPWQAPARAPAGKPRAVAVVAGVPVDVARRELARLQQHLGDMETEVRVLSSREGPGNALLVEIPLSGHGEVFTGLGERGLPAETVADRLARMVRGFLDSDASVGEHLADQLLLPLALAGGGGFTAPVLSSHARTNMAVIQRFLPVEFAVESRTDQAGAGVEVRVSVSGR